MLFEDAAVHDDVQARGAGLSRGLFSYGTQGRLPEQALWGVVGITVFLIAGRGRRVTHFDH